MAGTIPISMTQQFDVLGKPLAGGQLYIIQVGTVSTPQDAFQDTGLTIKQPYPMTLDAAGRVPQFFLADGSVKIRLQDKNGVVQLTSDSVMVIGPSSGGGGGGGSTVEASAIFQTGDIKARYAVGIHPGAQPGWVRANGLTIGSTTSGASMPEGASASCQALFLHLYAADASLAVSGGRTGNALNDWNSNKTIATPDWRGYEIAALDDMGNVAANRLGAFFAGPTTLGSAGGVPSVTLGASNLTPHTHGGNTGVMVSGTGTTHKHTVPAPNTKAATASTVGPGPGGNLWFGSSGAVEDSSIVDVNHTHTITTDDGSPTLGSVPFGIISPRKLCTIYLKL